MLCVEKKRVGHTAKWELDIINGHKFHLEHISKDKLLYAKLRIPVKSSIHGLTQCSNFTVDWQPWILTSVLNKSKDHLDMQSRKKHTEKLCSPNSGDTVKPPFPS
jgi:hypothetical protein